MTAAHRRSSVQISIYSRKELNSPDRGVVVQTPCNTNHRCFAKGAKIKLYSETDTAPLLQLSYLQFLITILSSPGSPPKNNFSYLPYSCCPVRTPTRNGKICFYFIPFTEKVNGIQRLFLYFGAAAPPGLCSQCADLAGLQLKVAIFQKKSQDSMETFVHSCKIEEKRIRSAVHGTLLRDGPAAHRRCAFIRSVQGMHRPG